MNAPPLIPKRPEFYSIVLGIALAAALCTASVFYFLKENEAGEKLRAQRQLEGVTQAQRKLEGDMMDLRVSSAELREKISRQEETIASLTQDLTEQRSLRQKAEAEIAVKQAEMEGLHERIRKADEARAELENRLEKQYEDYYQMKTQLGTLLKTKEELEQKAKELAENGPVSLGTVIIRQNPAPGR